MAKSSKKTSKTTKKTTKKKVVKKAPSKSTKKKLTKKTAKEVSKKVSKKKTKSSSKKVAKKSTKKKVAKKATKRAKPLKIKTHFSAKELRHYRDLLLERRLEIIGDIVGLEDSALRGKDASNLSNMPLHMADVGSDNYNQDLALGLMETERQLLNEIDEALDRIAAKTFGVCHKTGKPISKARLEAKPWAKYCIEAAREMERKTPRRF